jgi:hypothetical protein
MTDTDTPSVNDTQDPLQKPEGEHPYWQDLNPDFLKGENYGNQGPHPEKTARTAHDLKGLPDRLQAINDEDLKRVPIMPPGSRLEQGATYVDLRQSQPEELTATGNMSAGEDNWYVPKSSVPYWIWNILIGVENPERLDRAGEGG